MNREILFRGKDSAGWAYGDLIHLNGSVLIKPYLDMAFPVQPETVGQYTGLKDRNGNRIFEGDILKAVRSDRERIFHVEYTGTEFYVPEFHWNLSDVDFDYQLEVIGNIYDNPELIPKGEY